MSRRSIPGQESNIPLPVEMFASRNVMVNLGKSRAIYLRIMVFWGYLEEGEDKASNTWDI
jgi:hypothetical protein